MVYLIEILLYLPHLASLLKGLNKLMFCLTVCDFPKHTEVNVDIELRGGNFYMSLTGTVT